MTRNLPAPYSLSHWSDERTERLTKLWDEGLSGSQIARDLGGVSRNAVIGKVHRLNLAGRKEPSAPTAARVPRAPSVRITPQINSGLGRRKAPDLRLAGMGTVFAEPANPRPPRANLSVSAFDPLPGSAPLPWGERRSGLCCWPVGGEGADMLACCEPVHARGWCGSHFARGTVPAAIKRRVDERIGIVPMRRAYG